MDYRTFDLTLISANDLKKAFLFGKSDVYAVAYISGTAGNQMLRTPIDKNGGSNPTWNCPMKFTLDFAAILQNRLRLIVEINAVGMFGDKHLGEVHFKFMENCGSNSEQMFVSPRVISPSGKKKGYLNVTYRVGEKISGNSLETLTGYPSRMVVGSCPAYQPPVAEYAYLHQQQPGYGGYPLPPPPGYGGYPPQMGYGYPAGSSAAFTLSLYITCISLFVSMFILLYV
ncbi:hypothetical protein Lser_V15G27972 [Lactuca serriola]